MVDKTTSNILSFKKRNDLADRHPDGYRMPPTELQRDIYVMKLQMHHIYDVLWPAVQRLLLSIGNAGFPDIDNIENEDLKKDVMLVVESLRSVLMKYYDLDHPLQNIAHAFFNEPDPDTTFKYTWNSNLELELGEVNNFATNIIKGFELDIDASQVMSAEVEDSE